MDWVGPAAVGLVTTVALMLALRPLAAVGGLVDHPGGRKSHIGDVPVIGGIAMFFGMAAGLALVPGSSSQYLFMLLAGGLLLGVGVIDDRSDLSIYVRLGAQIIAATVMVFGGELVVRQIGNPLGTGTLALGAYAYPFTVLVSVTVINAFNFIDGVDGLAGSLAAVAIGAVAFVAIKASPDIALASVVACASILGFLLFNCPVVKHHRLRSFMGDAGSTVLGIIVLWLTISVSQGEARSFSPVIGLWIVLIPLADIFTCFTRRIARGHSPFRPGRGHLHHVLLRGQLSVRRVWAVLTALGILYACIGLLGNHLGVPDVVMFAGWALLMLFQYRLLKMLARIARSTRWRKRQRRAAAASSATLLPAASRAPPEART